MKIKTIKEFIGKFCTSSAVPYVFGIDGCWSYHLDTSFIKFHGDTKIVDVKPDYTFLACDRPQDRVMRFEFITKAGE